MKTPKIEEIIAVGILGYRSGKAWGDVYLEFKYKGEVYYKMIDFKHHKMRIFYTLGTFYYPFSRHTGSVKICEPDYKKVLRGDYDHIKITPLKYREELGIVSRILKQMIEEG